MVRDNSSDLADTGSRRVLESGASWIQKTPGVCGGDACIRNTRITIWGLAEWRRQGLSDAEILQRVPSVTEADLAAAWRYYEQHREEIESAIRENENV